MTSTQKTIFQADLIVGGVFITQDVMAVTDGTTLNRAWADSKLGALSDVEPLTE